jgi:hypothetical protein
MARLVIIICPNLRCRSVLQVPETVRGKKVRCGHCGTHFVVPARQAVTNVKVKDESDQSTDE